MRRARPEGDDEEQPDDDENRSDERAHVEARHRALLIDTFIVIVVLG
jgi:hypothetical protein